MGETYAVAGLRAKREQLVAEKGRFQLSIKKLNADIETLDHAIALLDPNNAPNATRLAGSLSLKGAFERGELKGIVLDALREAKKPLTGPDVAAHVIAERDIGDEPDLRRAVEAQVRIIMSSLKAKGILANGAEDAQGLSTYSLVR